uniref:Putative endodeoxyribonuclease n=1 Tax=viral metagenome TaxID=1070528 RepID=A0A6M3LL18_9ZZZZ
MPYTGSNLSVNHYKIARRYTRPEVKAWMEQLAWQLKGKHWKDWKLPLVITCSGVFLNRRSQPDLHNLSKVICDALEDGTGINDKDMRWHDGDVKFGKTPELEIRIQESE